MIEQFVNFVIRPPRYALAPRYPELLQLLLCVYYCTSNMMRHWMLPYYSENWSAAGSNASVRYPFNRRKCC